MDEVCQKGNTAFLMVCELQNKSIATYLLSIGANKFVRNDDGWTAFHFSCIHGNQAFATWLLGQGLAPQMITRHGRTSFHIACAHGHKAFAEWLLTLGLSKDAVDHEGNNALDLTRSNGHRAQQEVREYLLSIGLQTKVTRQSNQLQRLIASPSAHDNSSSSEEDEESEDMTAVTLVPIAMSQRSKRNFHVPIAPEAIPAKKALQITSFFIPIPNQLFAPFAKRLELQEGT